ncbi:hypothetical protein [Ideonella livida]|uniref:Uncharacterized protein n=1 Tax=Ideonella livida TaxID=2707176 RepID=A0A7C9TNJ3_9BURK|nr:hypothetical protein [Ideonella livida]NDY93923.1 hypothetical protein [Ideonella livida]
MPYPHPPRRTALSALLLVLGVPLALGLGGCKTLDPALPQGYTGPLATFTDSLSQDSEKRGQVFCLTAVDDQDVDNALDATNRATVAQGGRLVMFSKTRQLPAGKPVRLRLLGSQVFATTLVGAPLREWAMRVEGRFLSVSGEVEFTPVAGGHYLVTGELKPDGKSTVWLMDAETQQPVTRIVQEEPPVLPRLLPQGTTPLLDSLPSLFPVSPASPAGR